jgi:multiple sugar transport system ATP-binding protein
MGSELYAHFSVASDSSIESQELRELAEDAGGGEVPSAGEEGRIVARFDPQSRVRVGQEAEIWVDSGALHLFDPEDGRNLTTEKEGPAATGDGQSPVGQDPEARPQEGETRPDVAG